MLKSNKLLQSLLYNRLARISRSDMRRDSSGLQDCDYGCSTEYGNGSTSQEESILNGLVYPNLLLFCC